MKCELIICHNGFNISGIFVSHSFGQNASILRRWAHHSDTALPADWMAFVQANNTLAMNIQREDPVLVSLLRGEASASVMADAIEGKLSTKPESYDDRMKAQRQERMQHLANNNPFASGNMTEAMEVESMNPGLAKRLKREAGIALESNFRHYAGGSPDAKDRSYQ